MIGSNKVVITATDGKVFTGTIDDYLGLVNELNAYEANLKLKKEKDEAERKENVEKQKKIDEYRKINLKEINDDLSKVSGKIKAYEKATGLKIIYGIDYLTNKPVVQDTRNSIDFAWDNLFEDILKVIHKK